MTPDTRPSNTAPQSPIDQALGVLGDALQTLFAKPLTCTRVVAGVDLLGNEDAAALSPSERQNSARLMRVNHSGEICAQALYRAQALATKSESLRTHFEQAAREEGDHLYWTARRLTQLGARTSVLNPLWYAGSFALGFLAAKAGDALSLGFVVETERQVETHLQSHQSRLSEGDAPSRAIVAQMQEDERGHGEAAQQLGAQELPGAIPHLMRLAAKVMTHSSHWV